MAPSDVAGVFSRYFIVGFFLPAFFCLVALSQVVSDGFLPGFYMDLSDGTRIIVLGGAGLFLGLLLLGLNWQIFRLLEGYPLTERRRRPSFRWITEIFVARQNRNYSRLVGIRDDDQRPSAVRSNAAWRLDREFPPNEDQLLPTRFGNAVLAFESHAMKRWGLDSVAIWPRIDLLLSQRQAEQQANARGEAAFFVNGSLLLTLAGLAWITDQLFDHQLSGWELLAYLVPFVLAVVMARCATGAATRWGNAVRAAIDLKRFELYSGLGVRRPANFTEEREEIAPSINQTLVYGAPIPDNYFAKDPEVHAKESEE